jgi:hypothetical protein
MVNVISLDSTGIRTKCQSQSIQVLGVAELWLMSPYFLHNFLTSGVNIPEPPVIKKWRYSSTYVRTMAVVHRTSYQPPLPPKKVAIGRKSSYCRQTPPHPTHTTHAANCRKSETKVLYDRSNHMKASVQWRHVLTWFQSHTFKISVTKLSKYWSTTVHCPNLVAWYYSTLFHVRTRAVAI